MEASGKMFLKVVGILMIVFGGIAIVLDLIALVGSFALVALGASALLIFQCLVALASAGIELAVGVIGVVNCEKTEKAQTCFIGGCVVAGLSLLGNLILPLITSGASVNVFSLLIGLVLPVLFIIGALKNKGAM